MKFIQIASTGSVVPKQRVDSDSLDLSMGLEPGTVKSIGGLSTRHFAGEDETAASMGAAAAHIALERAGMQIEDIDCLVAASGTADQVLPSNAALILHEFKTGASSCLCFDINTSCMGFFTSLNVVADMLEAKSVHNVLIVASDISSAGLNWHRLEESAIFGDGAAAAIIRSTKKGGTSRILASKTTTIPSGAHLCEIVGAGSRHHPTRTGKAEVPLFHMHGKNVYRCVADHFPALIDELFAETQHSLEDIDHIVPHQASRLGLEYLIRKLGFPRNRVIRIFEERGNQVAASLPSALDQGISSGRIKRGDKVLLVGSGAGITIGGSILEY